MAEIKPWDTAYEIPENPIYDSIIRALKCSDPANAETIFNPLIKQIITNVHAVKLSDDGKAEIPIVSNVNLTVSSWTGSTAPYTQQVSVDGIVKTNNSESLIYVVPVNLTDNVNAISDCNITVAEISSNKIKFSANKKPSASVSFIIINAGVVNGTGIVNIPVGSTTADTIKNTLPINKGGTGATDVINALKNLNILNYNFNNVPSCSPLVYKTYADFGIASTTMHGFIRTLPEHSFVIFENSKSANVYISDAPYNTGVIHAFKGYVHDGHALFFSGQGDSDNIYHFSCNRDVILKNWTKMNDGGNADTVDGKHAAEFATVAQMTTANNSLNNKVDKITGKGLSTNDFTVAYKTKLDGIATGAEANIQSDWNVTDNSSDAFIKNKPNSIPANGGNADTVDGKHATDFALASQVTTINNSLNNKIDKITGKGLSTNDFTAAYKTKLDDIANNAVKVEKSSSNGNIKVNSTEMIVYNHPNGNGNNHIPSGGLLNQILMYDELSGGGTAKWHNIPNRSSVIYTIATYNSPEFFKDRADIVLAEDDSLTTVLNNFISLWNQENPNEYSIGTILLCRGNYIQTGTTILNRSICVKGIEGHAVTITSKVNCPLFKIMTSNVIISNLNWKFNSNTINTNNYDNVTFIVISSEYGSSTSFFPNIIIEDIDGEIDHKYLDSILCRKINIIATYNGLINCYFTNIKIKGGNSAPSSSEPIKYTFLSLMYKSALTLEDVKIIDCIVGDYMIEDFSTSNRGKIKKSKFIGNMSLYGGYISIKVYSLYQSIICFNMLLAEKDISCTEKVSTIIQCNGND